MRRITVLFDAENHQEEVAVLKSWKLPYHFSFRGYHIKAEDENNCPRLLWDCGTINMPFTKDDVTYALDIIALDARIINPTKSYHIRKNPRPYHSE